MDVVLLCARGILALVFIVAGVGKLLDLSGTRAALRGFGVPARWAAKGMWWLPLVELATAAALLIQPLARVGAVAALLLFAAFVVGVAKALREGRAPDCHCFGQLHSAPAGRGTILRNVALAVPAALVIAAGPGDTLAGVSPEGAALVAVSALATAFAVATLVMLRESRGLFGGSPRGELPVPLDIGAKAPGLRLRDAQEETVALADVMDDERPTVLVFVTPKCAACKALMPQLESWRPALAERVALVVIRASVFPPSAEEFAESPQMLWDVDDAAFKQYRLWGAPCAVRLDPGGVIASTPTVGAQAIEALIRVARLRQPRPAGRTAA